jgi:predicted Rossmann fold nucleotide-binding protein DprA/Smf involved in DNA uptake
MIEPLTSNTQAILLLTAPLIAGRGEASHDLLTLGEYNKLARILRDKQKQPADLIGSDAQDLIELCAQPFGRARLDALLGRGFLLSQAVERWNARGIWVISRADSRYPKRLKTRLKEDAPPLLYGCGEIALLEKGGLAVVGSRHVDDELISYTENVGRLAAQAHHTLISGAAKGIDRAAMIGALQAGGVVIGVMADCLERGALARDNREALMDCKLVLISPYDPAAGFNVGHAMQRNKTIYALADAALIVSSDFEKGGTWAGAIEQLEKLHFVPLFVRNGDNVGKGNSALLQQGAIPWPNPYDADELTDTLTDAAKTVASEPKQESLSFALREQASPYKTKRKGQSQPISPVAKRETHEAILLPAERLFNTMREILVQELAEPKNEKEVAELLGISKIQAKAWLAELATKGVLKKLAKPIRYRAVESGDSLL